MFFTLISFSVSSLQLLELIPEINDKYYVLHQYEHYKYDNITQCLLTEYKPNDEAYKKEILDLYNDFHPDYYFGNLSYLLVDPNDDLTFDEKFSIYIYIKTSVHRDQRIQLRLGVTGKLDCYVDYFERGLKKLKPIKEKIQLYRGTTKKNMDDVWVDIEDFKIGSVVSSSSFTSASSELLIGLTFAVDDYRIVFNITACRNPRNITVFNEKEYEYLIPPMTRFKVTGKQIKWCKYNFQPDLAVCQDEENHEDNEYHMHLFINLDEFDEDYGPFITVPRKSPKKKKKGGCSPKNDDDDNVKQSSLLLGDFDIGSVYLGSSQIYEFQPGYIAMQKARELIGHIIPPPNFLHSAIWLGPSNSSNNTLGAIFAYGKYTSNFKDLTYLSSDGARSYTMSLNEFKREYDFLGIKKLTPLKNLTIHQFINEIKASGNWRAKDYKWPLNNCQHFTSKCISILNAIRDLPDKNDWTILPPPILNILSSNENLEINKK